MVSFAVSTRADKEFLVPFVVSAHAGKERWLSPFRLVRTRSFLNLSNDLREAFLAIFIAKSLDQVIEEVFGEEIAHCDGNGRSLCHNFIILNTFM